MPIETINIQNNFKSLEKKILWLIGGRLLFITLILNSAFFLESQGFQRPKLNHHPLFWILILIYLLSLIYYLIFTRISPYSYKKFALIQLFIDLFLINVLVFFTGIQDSLFIFCYLLIIIGASTLLYQYAAYLFAFLSTISLAFLLFLPKFLSLKFLFFRSYPPIPSSRLLFILIFYSLAFFLTAVLSNYLAEQLRHSGEIIRRQQIDIKNLQALQQDIIHSINSGLIAADLNERILFYNRYASTITGYSEIEIANSKITHLFPQLKSEITSILYRKLSSTQRELSFFNRKEGRELYLNCSLSALHNRNKQQNGILLLFQDITKLKEIERKSREKEKLAALGEMAAGLAHEIRNPLSSLYSAIQLLTSELTLPDEYQKLLQIAAKEIQRLNSLLSDFLLFARPNPPNKTEFQLYPFLQQLLLLSQKNQLLSKLQLSIDVPQDCPIYADSQMLHQVLLNLLLNAAEAIENSPSSRGKVRISATSDSRGTTITVEDDGSGIPPHLKDKIFKPFFSTKRGGTGLGLPVILRIVEAHSGKVELHNIEPHGTRFSLFFPAKNSHAGDSTPSSKPNPTTSPKESAPPEINSLHPSAAD